VNTGDPHNDHTTNASLKDGTLTRPEEVPTKFWLASYWLGNSAAKWKAYKRFPHQNSACISFILNPIYISS